MVEDFEADKGTLDKKPKTSGFKVTSDRLRKGKENHLAHRPSLDFRLDKKNVCEKQTEKKVTVLIEDLKKIILKSRTGEAMLCAATDLEIYYDAQTTVSQLYLLEDKAVITLNPNNPKGTLINTLVRELRRVWQHNHKALVNPMSYEPDVAILVNRAQQSDVLVTAIKVAWELKFVEEDDAWDFLSASSFSGMTRSFEITAQKDFRSLNNGEASREAYDKFFKENGSKIYDKKIIHQMLLDDKGYMKNPAKKPNADLDLFSNLGDMPNSSNYLTSKGRDLPNEDTYSKVGDRSNANFLWFIKFERSFQEKEIEMVKETAKASAEIVDFATILHSQNKDDETRV